MWMTQWFHQVPGQIFSMSSHHLVCFSLRFWRLRLRCWKWIVASVWAPMMFHTTDSKIVLSDLHCLFACSSTGHWQRVSSPIDGNSRLLLPFARVVGAMTYRITVALRYCRLFKMLVYRVMSEDLRTVNMALLRVGRVSLICSNIPLSF
jgi:hypothetical protein